MNRLEPTRSAYVRAKNDWYWWRLNIRDEVGQEYCHGYFDRLLGLCQKEWAAEELTEKVAQAYELGWLDADGDFDILDV